MKLVTYITRNEPDKQKIGAILDQKIVDLHRAQAWAGQRKELVSSPLPDNLIGLASLEGAFGFVRELVETIVKAGVTGNEGRSSGSADFFSFRNPQSPVRNLKSEDSWGVPADLFPADPRLVSPIPRPLTIRDFYAFEKHVKTAWAARGSDIPQEWYEFPVFYFSNPNAIFGPDQPVPRPKASRALDYELEIACLIGKAGIDIPVEEAEAYIAGYMIMNDWSARDIQRKEMKVLLGPAKGKDFALSLGPYLVTPDEIEDRKVQRGEEGKGGSVYDLPMTARVNNIERSRGNWKDITYTFSEMIARASSDTFLFPGDVIGSGTVGTGCLLELTKGKGPWLEPGDIVELEVERLGVLRNIVE